MATTTKHLYQPDYAVPPGLTLKDTLEALSMDQVDLARRIDITEKHISQIVHGKAAISPEIALKLELATGVPGRLWMNLESNYRLALKRKETEAKQKADQAWLKNLPLKWMEKWGHIPRGLKDARLVESVFRFFGVTSVNAWESGHWSVGAAYRRSEAYQGNPGAMSVWLRAGELAGQSIAVRPYQEAAFQQALIQIREWTTQSPNEFQLKMRALLAEVGVAWVMIPEVKGCPVSGVMRWLDSDKALIQMSLRYKTDDHFWFTFFHETKHVLQGRRKEAFLEQDHNSGNLEEEANQWSANFLIPPEYQARLHTLRSKDKVIAFAREVGVSPGIVVGRLQHEGILKRHFMNDLKKKFIWQEG